jgi:pimeloyl-ACP methyl ester carboxylesterase
MLTRTALVLHGGGGPATVANIAAHLSSTFDVVAPVHPGWDGTAGVPGDTIRDLAARYLDDLGDDVLVVGSSVGGWIAAEMAVQDACRPEGRRAISQLVLVDTVGIEVAGEPIRDFFALDARGVAEYAWADPERGLIDPAALTPERQATMRGNMQALRGYAGDPYMHDLALVDNLPSIAARTLLLWGTADRIVTPAYGRAFAAHIPGAAFVLVDDAGHLPHLENPAATFAALDAFVGS